MENVNHALIQICGMIMFVIAVTLLLGYINAYECTFDNMTEQLKRDAVIADIGK